MLQKRSMTPKPGASPRREMKRPQTRMERDGGRCMPFRSWIQPMPGWAREDTALYTVTRRPAAKYEYPVPEDEEGDDGGKGGPVEIGDQVGDGEARDGAGGRRHADYSLLILTISTSISTTSRRWKAKVLFRGKIPPMANSISALPAV